MHRALFIAATLACTPAFSAPDHCPPLDVKILVDRGAGLDPYILRDKLPSGKGFKIQISGALPGTFFLSSVNESGGSKDIPRGFFSDGSERIILPCSPSKPCSSRKFQISEEGKHKIVIEYFPCVTGKPNLDKVLEPIHAHFHIEPCTGSALVRSDKEYNLDRDQISSTGSICVPLRDGDDRVFLDHAIEFTVAR